MEWENICPSDLTAKCPPAHFSCAIDCAQSLRHRMIQQNYSFACRYARHLLQVYGRLNQIWSQGSSLAVSYCRLFRWFAREVVPTFTSLVPYPFRFKSYKQCMWLKWKRSSTLLGFSTYPASNGNGHKINKNSLWFIWQVPSALEPTTFPASMNFKALIGPNLLCALKLPTPSWVIRTYFNFKSNETVFFKWKLLS